MNKLRQKSLEKIKSNLVEADYEAISEHPIGGRMYSKYTVKAVAYGLRNNEIILTALLDMVEEKLQKFNSQLKKIEKLSNGE